MKFLGTLFLFVGYSLVYAAVARGGVFATDPWNGLFFDAYTDPNLPGGNTRSSSSGSSGGSSTGIGSGSGTGTGSNPVINRGSIKQSGGINVSRTSNLGGRNRGKTPGISLPQTGQGVGSGLQGTGTSTGGSRYNANFNQGFQDGYRGRDLAKPTDTAYITGYNAGWKITHPFSGLISPGGASAPNRGTFGFTA